VRLEIRSDEQTGVRRVSRVIVECPPRGICVRRVRVSSRVVEARPRAARGDCSAQVGLYTILPLQIVYAVWHTNTKGLVVLSHAI